MLLGFDLLKSNHPSLNSPQNRAPAIKTQDRTGADGSSSLGTGYQTTKEFACLYPISPPPPAPTASKTDHAPPTACLPHGSPRRRKEHRAAQQSPLEAEPQRVRYSATPWDACPGGAQGVAIPQRKSYATPSSTASVSYPPAATACAEWGSQQHRQSPHLSPMFSRRPHVQQAASEHHRYYSNAFVSSYKRRRTEEHEMTSHATFERADFFPPPQAPVLLPMSHTVQQRRELPAVPPAPLQPSAPNPAPLLPLWMPEENGRIAGEGALTLEEITDILSLSPVDDGFGKRRL